MGFWTPGLKEATCSSKSTQFPGTDSVEEVACWQGSRSSVQGVAGGCLTIRDTAPTTLVTASSAYLSLKNACFLNLGSRRVASANKPTCSIPPKLFPQFCHQDVNHVSYWLEEFLCRCAVAPWSPLAMRMALEPVTNLKSKKEEKSDYTVKIILLILWFLELSLGSYSLLCRKFCFELYMPWPQEKKPKHFYNFKTTVLVVLFFSYLNIHLLYCNKWSFQEKKKKNSNWMWMVYLLTRKSMFWLFLWYTTILFERN